MTTSNNIDNQCVSNIAGFNETFSVLNNNAAANLGSAATIIASVNGAAVGDPVFQSSVTGVQTWTFGADNTDGDRFKVSNGAALGTNDCIQINTAGAPGSINYPLQPIFSAYVSATVINTGHDAVYQTVVFDTKFPDMPINTYYNNTTGIFTAPVDGIYLLSYNIQTTACTIAGECRANLVVGAKTYFKMQDRAPSADNFTLSNTVLTKMTLGQTARVAMWIVGEAANTDGVFSDGSPWCYFSGMLVR